MTRKSPLAPVGHMLECAEWAITYIDGMGKEDFLDDRRTQQAVIMNLLIIGEMASRLARDHPEIWENHPQAPWRHITSMRNRIAHGYFDLNLDTIWDTASTSLPELICIVKPIFDELAASHAVETRAKDDVIDADFKEVGDDASSDSATEPNDQIEPVIVDDGSAVTSPLDFSGSSLGLAENAAGSAQWMDEPSRPSELALETADLADALCAKIAAVSFGDRVFLFHSEAEAWRYAIETMRRRHQIAGRPKRRRLIVCADVDGAGGLPPGLEGDGDVTLLQTDDPGALATEIDNRTAGILIAPVRMRTGFDFAPRERLLRLRETADEYGLVLAFDESLCGLGRTGMLWAHEWTGAPPDMMVALHQDGNSPPLAALVVTREWARGAPVRPLPLDHATLLSGHAIMDALAAPGFLERVQNRSWRLEDRLTALFYKRPGAFAALGGIGLMQGLACHGEAEPMRAMLAERGLLTRAMGSFLGLIPPLTVEESEIDAAVSIIDAVCTRQTQ